jgi:2-haloacid dehalogenase
MPDVPMLIFDVNETLLDIEVLKPQFQKIFGDGEVLREWFAQLILYSEAITLARTYVPFGELGGAVLRMIGATRGISISDQDALMLKEAVATMPPHAEVPVALNRLRASGFRLFTLTNNPMATCERQLRHGGIAELFELLFSVDEGVRRYKPAPEVYRAVQESLSVTPSQLLLIACHTWDIIGASAEGWQTALIRRAGNAALGIAGQPSFVGDNLEEITDQLIQRFSS